MNVNQIVSLVMRLFLRKVISRGIDKGFDLASSRKKPGKAEDPEAAKLQKAQGRDTAKRATKAMRVTRRMGRM